MRHFLVSLAVLWSFCAFSSTVKTPVKIIDDNGDEHGTGLIVEEGVRHGVLNWAPRARMGSLPEQYDLRPLGWVAPIKDQGSCGSCWAFSIMGSLESALLRAGHEHVPLSEQEMISCDRQAYGCGGGFMSDMAYVVEGGGLGRGGISSEADYPQTSRQTGRNGVCKNPLPAVAAKAVRWGYCGSQGREPTLAEIKQCLVDYGVLSVVVAAGGNDWSRGGDMNGCGVRGQNHMVNLVGWRSDDKLIIKNSWGSTWGDHGFGYASQGCDQLAKGSESVSFVVVEGDSPAPVIPHITLPAKIEIHLGTEIALGRHVPEAGVSYTWFADDEELSQHESMIYVSPERDTIYKIVATTASGTAESSVLVKVLSAR